ncbi:ATP-binding cassette domain-containing protein [Azospirillum sp. INR13]|nr:ATP-binding cassette domain-containing protein [Azospirillum sp. INR13]
MQDVVDIIQSEHRSMHQISAVLELVCRDAGDDPDALNLTLVDAGLAYFAGFSREVHHPKEEGFVFAPLRGLSVETDRALDQLTTQHVEEAHQLEKLRQRVHEARDRTDRARVRDDLLEFLSCLGKHIQLEETAILPLVRSQLPDESRKAAYDAFLAHSDPLSADADRAFTELRHIVASMAPAPFGLGAREAALNTAVSEGTVLPLLALEGIDAFYGSRQSLHGITVEAASGRLVSIVGSNGAGKTTLLKTISGIHPTRKGRILFEGSDIARLPAWRRVALGIAHCPEGRQVFGTFTVEQNLQIGGFTQPTAGVAEAVEQMYALFPVLKEKRRQSAATLSGGQQQMLAIARSLMSRPKLLLLDEPSMGLAPLIVEEVFAIISRLRRQGLTILLVEQNAAEALPLSDQGYVLETGRIVLQGPGQELAGNEQVRQAYLGL